MLDDEVQASSVLLEGKDIEVSVIVEHELELHTAKQVLWVVLGNLIRNAMNYTKQGRVDIFVKDKSVVVSDTGIGMDPTQIQRIFQPYYRANDGEQEEYSRKSLKKGYGVGLTIVKRLSNRFHWTLDVESSIGQGTRIEVNFE